MDTRNLYELIESYLAKRLDPERLEAIEQQMAEDDVFREAVEARKASLVASPEVIPDQEKVKELIDSNEEKGGGYQKAKLILLVLSLFFAGWQIGMLVSELPDSPEETPEIPAPRAQLKPVESTATPPITSDERFVPNPAFETLIEGGIRSRALDLVLSEPRMGAFYTQGAGGRTTLEFKGEAHDTEVRLTARFRILIFNNQDVENSIQAFSFRFKKRENENNRFQLSRTLQLDLGLYYFLVQSEDGDQLLYTGKFIIR